MGSQGGTAARAGGEGGGEGRLRVRARQRAREEVAASDGRRWWGRGAAEGGVTRGHDGAGEKGKGQMRVQVRFRARGWRRAREEVAASNGRRWGRSINVFLKICRSADMDCSNDQTVEIRDP